MVRAGAVSLVVLRVQLFRSPSSNTDCDRLLREWLHFQLMVLQQQLQQLQGAYEQLVIQMLVWLKDSISQGQCCCC